MQPEDILSFIKGAVRFDTSDGYIFPRRFTKEQEEFLLKRGDGAHARNNASQKLEFTTSGGKLKLDLCYIDGNYARTALYDNKICVKRSTNEPKDGKETFEYDIPYGEKRTVTLYFGNTNTTGFKNVTLPLDASPVKNKLKYLALGDSITHGFYSDIPALTYVNILADMMNAEVLNCGVSGEIFLDGMLDNSSDFAPDIITVAYGTNDWDKCGDCFTENVRNYFIKLKALYPNAEIFVLTPIYRGREDEIHSLGTLNDVRNIIKENACGHIIDGLTLFDRTHGFYGDGGPEEAGLHPNTVGFLLYGMRLFAQIRSLCPELFDTNGKI